MKIFDRYVFKNLFVTTVFVALTLVVVIFLTQSLRFLELVIESGASSSSFWILTLLALPRFFEVILPLAMMAATLFTYNRMTADSELIVIRSVGYSPLSLAKPALILATIVTVFLWSMTMWAAPKALSQMQGMQEVIKSQLSSFLFREGVFNQIGTGLTVYIRKRNDDGDLRGLMIQDARAKNKNPSTITAQRGMVVSNEENKNQVVVYDGARQEYDPETKILHRLNFERYTIDLPNNSPVRQRWSEPDERTIIELLNPDPESKRDQESLRDFKIEIHKRFVGPLLTIVFCLISCCSLLIGPIDRRGQTKRIVFAIISVVVIQGLFLAGFNLARRYDLGLLLIYALVLVPMFFSAFLLSGSAENLRRSILYAPKRKAAS